jgi:hypothetical protein
MRCASSPSLSRSYLRSAVNFCLDQQFFEKVGLLFYMIIFAELWPLLLLSVAALLETRQQEKLLQH